METKKITREEYQKCVNAVVDYINLHLGEEIDLKSLARISHFSPFYFHRIMKAFLGEPVGTFIVRTRTETAARLLRYTDLPIADIAYRIGYSSSSSLSKVFKQFYGISPLEYRNNKNFVIMKPAIIRPELLIFMQFYFADSADSSGVGASMSAHYIKTSALQTVGCHFYTGKRFPEQRFIDCLLPIANRL